jgi:hypothetical protein
MPGPSRRFTDQFAWLLATVARDPGTTSRFSTEDVLRALAVAAANLAPSTSATDTEGVAEARRWLEAMHAGATDATRAESTTFIAVLEHLLRLPTGYFLDEQLRHSTDQRIEFASVAAARGVRISGPCRGFSPEIHPIDVLRRNSELLGIVLRPGTVRGGSDESGTGSRSPI